MVYKIFSLETSGVKDIYRETETQTDRQTERQTKRQRERDSLTYSRNSLIFKVKKGIIEKLHWNLRVLRYIKRERQSD